MKTNDNITYCACFVFCKHYLVVDFYYSCHLVYATEFVHFIALSVDNAHPEIECALDMSQTVNFGTTNVQVNFPATVTDDCNDVCIRYTSSGATSFNSRTNSRSSIGTFVQMQSCLYVFSLNKITSFYPS